MERALPVIFLMGPTACGKTAAALHLHAQFPCDLISVDSAMIYRGMDIGTAKPTAAQLKRVPHRLIDIRDPSEPYSVAEFCQDVYQAIAEIHACQRIPLLVGGTLMYFRALQTGLSRLPSADAEVRERIGHAAQTLGWPALHALLAEQDPVAAARIHPNDTQRIQRALEVFELTGTALSELQKQDASSAWPFRTLKIALAPPHREVLNAPIVRRFQGMLENGLLDEVAALRQRGDLHRNLPSMRCVGYRQAWDYFDGNLTHADLIIQAVKATRMLAKRQYTWLSREQNCHWVDAGIPNVREHLQNWIAENQ